MSDLNKSYGSYGIEQGNTHFDSNKVKELYSYTYDKYAIKYNNLLEELERLGGHSELVEEILDLKTELIKINIMIKMEDLLRI